MSWLVEAAPVDLEWRLEPDEFLHVWTETDVDDLPEPLRLRSRFPDQTAASRGREGISARWPLRGDPELSVALRTLAKPAVRIIMVGNRPDGSEPVRIVGARIQNTAVLAVQEPGPRPDHGGAVRLWLGEWPAMAEHVTRALPRTQPGRVAQVVASVSEVQDESFSFTVPALAQRKTPAERIREMLAARRDAQGVVRIERGLLQDRPSPPTYFSWMDIADDGRYLVSNGYDLTISAATSAVVSRMLG